MSGSNYLNISTVILSRPGAPLFTFRNLSVTSLSERSIYLARAFGLLNLVLKSSSMFRAPISSSSTSAFIISIT